MKAGDLVYNSLIKRKGTIREVIFENPIDPRYSIYRMAYGRVLGSVLRPVPSKGKKPMRDKNLFAFGTLRSLDRMQSVTGRENWTSEPAILTGYSRIFPRASSPVPYLLEDPEGSVEGVLYHDLDAESLRHLDIYEGTPTHYYRETKLVSCPDSGEEKEAEVYLTGKSMREHLERGIAVRFQGSENADWAPDADALLERLEAESWDVYPLKTYAGKVLLAADLGFRCQTEGSVEALETLGSVGLLRHLCSSGKVRAVTSF